MDRRKEFSGICHFLGCQHVSMTRGFSDFFNPIYLGGVKMSHSFIESYYTSSIFESVIAKLLLCFLLKASEVTRSDQKSCWNNCDLDLCGKGLSCCGKQ